MLGGGFRKDGPSPPKSLTAETVGSSLRERPTLMIIHKLRGFPGGSDSEEPACSAEDPGSIPGSGRSPGGGNGNHSSILAWEMPWTEEPGRLQSVGSQRVRHNYKY